MTGEEVFIAFEDFTAAGGSGPDFTDVGALEFVFDGPAAVDLRVELIGATTIVPEPLPMTIFGFAHGGLGLARRNGRKKAA